MNQDENTQEESTETTAEKTPMTPQEINDLKKEVMTTLDGILAVKDIAKEDALEQLSDAIDKMQGETAGEEGPTGPQMGGLGMAQGMGDMSKLPQG
jgi:N-methylhydantoinase B/oxoprolinase/acetone carboxylase alpha subunit